MTSHVSVIIPTLGRPSLTVAVESALEQDVDVEVLVVNDSGSPLTPPVDSPAVRVIDTEGRTGAAHARNVGMAEAKGEFLAFLDDDDVWLPGHLTRALQVLAERPDCDIVGCRGLTLQDDGTGRVEPAVLLGERSIATYFNSHGSVFGRNRRMMTPTLVFRRTLADHRMREDVTSHEDTWWLLTAERDRGARIVQSPHIGVVVHADAERETSRDGERDELEWARQLDSLHEGTGAAYLAASARQAAREGDPAAVLRLAGRLRDYPHGWEHQPAMGLQAGAAAAIGLLRRLRQRGARGQIG
ncbi:glycosyltransferase family 2 protein [Actinomycetota bacterium]